MNNGEKRLREIECGFVHGIHAGRLTAHERLDGTWDVIWHPIRGTEQLLKTFTEKDVAVDWAWAEYSERMGWD